MPNTASAKKALRVSERKRVYNLSRKRAMNDTLKSIRALVSAGKRDEAQALLPKAYTVIDKAAKRGVLKKNTAARRKSQISRLVKGTA